MYNIDEVALIAADYRHRRQIRNRRVDNLVVFVSERNWYALLNGCLSLPQFKAFEFDRSAQEFRLYDVRISWSPIVRDDDFVKGVYNAD